MQTQKAFFQSCFGAISLLWRTWIDLYLKSVNNSFYFKFTFPRPHGVFPDACINKNVIHSLSVCNSGFLNSPYNNLICVLLEKKKMKQVIGLVFTFFFLIFVQNVVWHNF